MLRWLDGYKTYITATSVFIGFIPKLVDTAQMWLAGSASFSDLTAALSLAVAPWVAIFLRRGVKTSGQ